MNTIKPGFNLMTDGLAQQKLVLDTNRASAQVIPIPTLAMRNKLHAEGKRIVHRPAELQKFVERTDDDFGPEAA